MNYSHPMRVLRSRPACVLRVAGPDAASFLQGQFSNDLRLLEANPSVYGLWLSHKGRVLADSHVLRQAPSTFWIVSMFSPAQLIEGHLQRHLIADEVEIEDQTGSYHGASLIGSGSGALAASEAPGEAIVFPGRRALLENWEVMRPSAEPAFTGVVEMGSDEAERLRIRSGIPAIPLELGPADLPNEGGIEDVAVSYSKGCYLGQEIMSRLRVKGRVRRRLAGVSGQGSPPALPAALWAGGARTGELRSAVPDGNGYIGMAMVGVASSEPGAALSLGHSDSQTLVVQAR